MFVKKATAAQIEAQKNSFSQRFGDFEEVSEAPVKAYMIKWLSSFAPEMVVADAKAFCLPRVMYRNYIWNAFSFQKTDCYIDEDAKASFEKGFEGPCYVIFNTENFIIKVQDGTVFNPENLEGFNNLVIFKEDYSETYVHTGNEEFGPFYKSADMTEIDIYDLEPEEPEEIEEDITNEEE